MITDPVAIADVACWLAQALGGIVFALIAELIIHRRYEPQFSWLATSIGTAQVGLIVAARLALAPIPDVAAPAAAWWAWWLIAWSFVSAGSPIAVWRLAVRSGQLAQSIRFLRTQSGLDD